LFNETGTHLNSLTFDGAYVNKTMCTKLNASFKYESLTSSITNVINKEPIFLFLDPCHMIKLVRNTFGDKQVFKNNEGKYIKWVFIEKLFEKQNTEGLRAGTKLTKRHLNYRNKKMNVRLVVQILSESVSKALIYCKEIDQPNCGEASATAEFCTMINQAFDILNSRNQFSKSPFNISINLNTINKYEEFSKRFKNYIGGLTFCNGQKIVDSNRNTGFIVLILSLESAINLFKYLHYNHSLKYLLTYKISQDHLESYFSAMRSMFGFNNNPNCQQFETGYKRLLVHHQLSSSEYGNCAILDATIILPLDNGTDLITDTDVTQGISSEMDLSQQTDHDYIKTVWKMFQYILEDLL